jgi:hypothetical protein
MSDMGRKKLTFEIALDGFCREILKLMHLVDCDRLHYALLPLQPEAVNLVALKSA